MANPNVNKNPITKGDLEKHFTGIQWLVTGVFLILLVALFGWYWDAIMFKASSYQALVKETTITNIKLDTLTQKTNEICQKLPGCS